MRFLKGIGKKVASNTDAILMAESLGITIQIREYRETLTFETPKDTVLVRSEIKFRKWPDLGTLCY